MDIYKSEREDLLNDSLLITFSKNEIKQRITFKNSILQNSKTQNYSIVKLLH